MKANQKRFVLNIGGIILSVLFLYLCFHSLDAQAIKQAFLIPHPWVLLGVVLLNVLLLVIRTYIWDLLLRPLTRLPFWTLFDLMHVGYMANNLLPLKAGEFFRASFVSKKWKLNYTQVLTTVGLEKYFEGFALLILFLFVAINLSLPVWIKMGALILGVILVFVQILLIMLWKQKIDLTKWESRPPFLYHFIKFFYHIGEGSQPLRSGTSFLMLLGLGMLTWVVQGAMLRMIEYAFQIHMDPFVTLFAMIAINLAISLPSAPSNLGTFEYATVLAYTSQGLIKGTALGIAFYFHFLQIIPVTIIGLYYYFRWGIRLKELEQAVETKVEAI
jgi:hypothetical protein